MDLTRLCPSKVPPLAWQSDAERVDERFSIAAGRQPQPSMGFTY